MDYRLDIIGYRESVGYDMPEEIRVIYVSTSSPFPGLIE